MRNSFRRYVFKDTFVAEKFRMIRDGCEKVIKTIRAIAALIEWGT